MVLSRKIRLILTIWIGLCAIALTLAFTTQDSFAAYSCNGYKTYVNADVTRKWSIPDGSNSCTAAQGMNVGTNYIYNAKIKTDNNYQTIVRTNANDGSQTTMSYYSSLSATSASSCNALGHANALSVAGDSNASYLFAATTQTGHGLCKLKIDGTKLYKTGHFDLVNTAGTSLAPGGIKCIGLKNGYFHFLIKANMTFYRCSIPATANGGSTSAATKVTCYKVFTIDTRNAVFASSNTAAATVNNLETWINQDFAYCADEKSIYVPLYNGGSDNVIIRFNVTSFVNVEDWPTSTKETTTVIFPSKTTCHISGFEIESVGFRTSQGTTGDRKLYFCTNGSPDSIYTVNMTSGTTAVDSIYSSAENIAYSVTYDGNGGVQSDSLETRDKMTATRHIVGIVTQLRPNKFTRSGYTFAGWHLYRDVTGKPRQYLYMVNGQATWYDEGKQPADAPLAIYSDKQRVGYLAAEKGTKVYCVAQWKPNLTGTQSFYVRYEPNGGTGTMADTKITYGTTTATRKNTFTREGYIFSGWLAHRKASDSWSYTKTSDLTDTWIASSDSKSGYFKKTYNDGCNLAKTSGTDGDIVTFYACWSRLTGSMDAVSIKENETLSMPGSIESNTDFYDVTATLMDAGGNTVASKTAVITTSAYEIDEIVSKLETKGLATGEYKLNISARTRNTATALQTIDFGDIDVSIKDNIVLSAPVIKAEPNDAGKPYISWNAVEGATAYDIYHSTTSAGEFILIGTTDNHSYTDESAAVNQTYYYKVTAKDENGNASVASAKAECECKCLVHSGGVATCTSQAECAVCGAEYGELAAHKYSEATCTTKATCTVCGAETGELVAHNYSKATCTTKATCTVCGAETGELAAHSFKWITDKEATATATGSKHEECTVCGYKKSAVTIDKLSHTHSGGKAICKAKAKCTICGAEYGELAAHNYSEATCTAKAKCTVCGAETGELADHKYSEATCTAKAKCTVCGAETGELADHVLKTTTVKKATMSVNGKTQTKCVNCGNVTASATVYAAKTVKLSKSKYAYSGKTITPAEIVKNSKGSKLVKGTDYTVSMAKGRTKVGYYAITVKGKGRYSFTKELKLTIKPNPTPIVKVTPGKKSFTVKWTKKTVQVDGYEIQYSTSSGFKTDIKAASIKSNKTVSRLCKNLKAKKKYYVRVRTYKTVNGKTIYSVWSAKKSVKTK